MAPPRRPPELMDDAVIEILLRLPPEDPACLARTSLVCKPWRRLLSDPGFPRRYREFHGAPPLLGFFSKTRASVSGRTIYRFVPTTATPPFPLPPLDPWSLGCVLDCRHGRVLLYWLDKAMIRLAVWDPIAGDRKVLPGLPRRRIPSGCCNGAVLCSARRSDCNHLDCHGGPFRVVLLGSGKWAASTRGAGACVYSSEAGTWTAPASVHFRESLNMDCWSRPTLVGDDDIYFRIDICGKIIKYDLGSHCLSVIEDPPFRCYYNSVLMATENALLGSAVIKDSRLQLWSREVKSEGAAGWVQHRVIELETLFPDSHPFNREPMIHFADGLGIVFVSMDAGLFSIDVKSWRVKKVSEPMDYYKCIPFRSFYTPGTVRAFSYLLLYFTVQLLYA
ncbi:unnamed protein product [Urochloa decumbens]|uniref:F-box domain-containing protein n=1 Tax=Urochloa decumbens TaxID=240449 RepID=A0ABC9FLX3_9POAL